MQSRYLINFLSGLVLLVLSTGCSAPKPSTMMETPVLYYNSVVDPFAHLDDDKKNIRTKIFYATNREPEYSGQEIQYRDIVSPNLNLGELTVRFGDDSGNWQQLYLASLEAERLDPVSLFLEETTLLASLPPETILTENTESARKLQPFVSRVNDALALNIDKDIIIYVHGAKDSFQKTASMSAELDHFSGRDFVSVAFSWPVHQNILSYLFRMDIRRAMNSTESLRALIDVMARHTRARQINIICYSAGARLVSKALQEMRRKHAGSNREELRKRYRLGTVIFTAADVPVTDFLDRLPAISDMARHVMVTVSDDDYVLRSATLLMGGGVRTGSSKAENREKDFVNSHRIDNFEIVDLSYGWEKRGFDITGHHYWYRHPWASSDILFLLRTDLPAVKRGLQLSDSEDGVWYLAPEYPESVRGAAEGALKGQW